MSIKIKLKHSAVNGKAPLPSDLDSGELALNTNAASPAAYIKDSAGNIVKLAGTGAIGGTDATTTAKGIVQLADATALTAGTAGRIVDAAQLKAVSDADDWTRTGTTLAPKTAGDVVNISAGTAALPGLTPVGDANSGLFSPGADQIAVATGGTGRLFVDGLGRTLIGTASALNVSGSAGYELFQIQGLGASLSRFSSAGNGPYLNFARSGSDTVGSNSAVPSSANIGALSFNGADGSTFAQAAEIRVAADGTPATGSMPGFISFLTTPSGATKSLERLRITSAGNVGIGTASPGSALEINAAAATSPFIAKVNNAEKLRIDSTGHVGIGTSAPSTLLHLASVTGSASPTPTELRIATASVGSDWSLTDPWGRISFYNQDSGGGGPKIHAAIDTIVSNILGNASELAFSLSANTSDTLSKRLSIKASGVINIADVPLYADIAAAQAGGLVAGDVFRNTASMLVIVS